MKFLLVLCFAIAQAVVANGRNLIRGGVDVTRGYDWIVDILDETGEQICTGSLISKKWVLTAAHCWDNEEPHTLKIRHYSNTNQRKTITRTIKWYIQHEDYGKSPAGYKINDIALIRLSKRVTEVTPVTLHLFDFPQPSDQDYGALGWGLTGTNAAENLQGTRFQIVSSDACNVAFDLQPAEYFPQPQMFCAQDLSQVSGACGGDSGGPLFNHNKVQVGVASFGWADKKTWCLKKDVPMVYSSVAAYIQWITAHAT